MLSCNIRLFLLYVTENRTIKFILTFTNKKKIKIEFIKMIFGFY